MPDSLPAALTPATAAVVLGAAALAGLLRGFSGFGFALAAVPALTIVLDPADVVPCVILLQVVAGAQLLPATWHAVDWASLGPLLAAALLATPLGTAILATAPADAMRAAIGLVLLTAVVLLGRGVRLARRPPLGLRISIGAVSGLLNGGTAMAGPPVIVYFLAAADSVEVGRASLLMYFFVLSIAGTLSAAAAGLVTSRTLWLAALMLPALLAGNALGHRLFARTSAGLYRRIVLATLAVIALVALARALVR